MITFHSTSFSTLLAKAMLFVIVLSVASFAFDTPGIAAQSVKVSVDQARIMRLSTDASTIIVGNPVIADVNIQDGRLLVVMGKSTGATNMIALDSQGREIANINIIVHSSGSNSLTLYKGSSRISMNCSPNCERTLYVGDSVPEFEKIEKQITTKMKAIKAAADFSN
jgi:Flp pilus assembly secretin CpaC